MSSHTKDFLRSAWKRINYKAALGIVVGAAVVVIAIGRCYQKNIIYKVYVNNKLAGYVDNIDEYEDALEKIRETDGDLPTSLISIKSTLKYYRNSKAGKLEESNLLALKPESKGIKQDTQDESLDVAALSEDEDNDAEHAKEEEEYWNLLYPDGGAPETAQVFAQEDKKEEPSAKDSYLTAENIERMARSELNLKNSAVAISVNGEELGRVANKAEADETIEKIKKAYYPQNYKYDVLSAKIKEDVVYSDVMEYTNKLTTPDDILEKVLNGKGIKKIYTVAKGDTVWDIAFDNDTTVEAISAMNPDMDIAKIQIGDKIKLSQDVPYLNVEVVAQIKRREIVPYETQTVKDATINKGSTKVTQDGKNGVAEVEAKVSMLNGNVVDESIVNSTTISNPVAKVVAEGTKAAPVVTTTNKVNNTTNKVTYVASSRYLRPTHGIISSRYGWRSRGFHTGVDFASPTGTAIAASNSGKVIYAGWKGNYGRCVMISHGNGIQTLYGHCSKLYVKVGQSVKKGQRIAAVGSTGNSTGPHVHFEVRRNGKHINPFTYIK